MNKKNRTLYGIITRYLILILLSLSSLSIFYLAFEPLTLYPTYFLLKLFFDSNLSGNIITIMNNLNIEIISACVAGSAYYLLLILNLSIQNVKLSKRIKMLLFAFLIFLTFNIIRIFGLGLIYVYDSPIFDFTHKLFWYFVSTILVVGIWFLEVSIFKIKEIPFVEDLKFLYAQSGLGK